MPPRSWPEFKYPTARKEEPVPSCEAWLRGKRIDDGAENLWRIHDKLYDLESFIDKHPGGAMWLTLSKGTDITEAFETHHLTQSAEKMLPKFYIRDATIPRNSPFTFHPNGFYKTIKRKVLKYFNNKPPQISKTSMMMLDFLMISGLISAVLAARYESVALAAFGGMLFGFVVNCGHNIVHMRDMWRNYYYYFTGFSVREWRVSHCLSHHLYPNTLKDLEIWSFEPLFQYLPDEEKPLWVRYGAWIYSPAVWALTCIFLIFNRVRLNLFYGPDYLLFVPPLLMLTLGEFQLYTVCLWIYILLFCGLTFASIGLTAAHHYHETFHEGDKPRSDTDWGLQQVDATLERKEIIGNKYLGLILFGDHTLHHLFPTLDCVHLGQLMPIYEETLNEFGVDLNMKSYPEIFRGSFLQLARNAPNLTPKEKRI